MLICLLNTCKLGFLLFRVVMNNSTYFIQWVGIKEIADVNCLVTANFFLHLSIFTFQWTHISNSVLNIIEHSYGFYINGCTGSVRFLLDWPPADCSVCLLSAGWFLSWILHWSCTCTAAASWWLSSLVQIPFPSMPSYNMSMNITKSGPRTYVQQAKSVSWHGSWVALTHALQSW